MNNERMPLQVWILTLSAFAIGTAEFVIAGILPQIAFSLGITEGKVGYLISAYALAIVFGGPLLTIYLAKFNKKYVLVGLMLLFILSNMVSAFSPNYSILLISRVLSGLVQGPFYGIGSVVATALVKKEMEGRAVGQMFAGLTLANVLGVPGGTWIGSTFGWHYTFIAVALLGIGSIIFILFVIQATGHEESKDIKEQLAAFKNPMLIIALLITVFSWSGFMTLYGYVAPIALRLTYFKVESITWLLVVVGVGLIIGNSLGGRSVDKNLHKASLYWALAMIASLILVGLTVTSKPLFVIMLFIFGIASFANVPPMQIRVMKHAGSGKELASTANISAFNIANAYGGFLGGLILDSSHLPDGIIPYAAIVLPLFGLLLILFINNQENKKGLA